MRGGGVLLLVLGLLLLVTGWWDAVMMWLRSWLATTTGLGTSVV
jgi:cytochrome c-type biogenesis protein